MVPGYLNRLPQWYQERTFFGAVVTGFRSFPREFLRHGFCASI